MPFKTPQTGDKPSAREQRRMTDQLRQQFTQTGIEMPDLYRPGLSFIAQIEDVVEASSLVWYEWQALAPIYSATGATTYIETGVFGDNEDYPYLTDIGQTAGAPPLYAIDDRVLVTVVDGQEGLAYVINSLVLGGDSPIDVDRQFAVNVTSAQTVTVDERNFLGRMIWYTISYSSYEWGGDPVGGGDPPIGDTDPEWGGHLAPRAHHSGYLSTVGAIAELDLDTVGLGAGSGTARLFIARTDSGKLKVEFDDAGDGCYFRITARATQRLEDDDFTLVSDP